MKSEDLQNIIANGQSNNVVFKKNVKKANDVATDIISLTNSGGGIIVYGIDDEGNTTGLSFEQMAQMHQVVTDTSYDLVNPPVSVVNEYVELKSKNYLVTKVPDGIYKPYSDKKGLFWIRSGIEKRYLKVSKEFEELFKTRAKLHADRTIQGEASVKDIDITKFDEFVTTKFGTNIEETGIPVEKLLTDFNLMQDGKLNLTSLLFFGKNPQSFRPDLITRAAVYKGKKLVHKNCLNLLEIDGTIDNQFYRCIQFIRENLENKKNANHQIPEIVFNELLKNAFIHRNYFKPLPIRVHIFENRIEIISPGRLPNDLKIENIKHGNICIRNHVINSFARKTLPYTNNSTGIFHILNEYPQIVFINYDRRELFKCIVYRPEEDEKNRPPKK